MNRLMGGLGDRFTKAKKLNYVSVSDAVKKYRDTLHYDVSDNKLLSRIILWRGDITKLESDAIVNAANETLLGGGGVDGAIHFAAGPELLEECKGLGGCETGQAKITKGYCLPAKYVIHTVGPRYRGRQKDKEHLAGCYENSLNLMLDNDIKTIAFPCISTGIFGYPNEDAADVALNTVCDWLSENPNSVENIIFCLFLEKDVDIYTEAIKDMYEQNNKDMECVVSDSKLQKECSNDAKEAVQDSLDRAKSTLSESHRASHDDTAGFQTIGMEASQARATSLSNDTDNQVGDPDEESGESNIQQPEDLQQSGCNEVDASPSSKSLKENQLPVCDLSSEERERWIENFGSFEIESVVKPIFEDTEEWLKDKHLKSLQLVGGLDISYHKTKSDVASVSLVVLSYPELELVYEDTTIEDITVPYIPGYLAYREAKHFHKKLEKVKETNFSPQVILVDGNGALHPRQYGSAVKVGVDADLPTIGVAKNLMIMEEFGVCHDKIGEIKAGGGTVDITSNAGYLLGKAVRTTDTSRRPVFVSVGHKCSLDSAVRIVLGCCRTRIPEPIRQADHLSKMKLKVTPP